MSNTARFDLIRRRRISVGSALALGIFATVLVAGSLLGISVWQHPENWPRSLRPPADIASTAAPPRNMPVGERYSVDVLYVVDGDTFAARVHLPFGHEFTTRVRLRGVDAPELKAHCERERVQAEAARAALRVMLADRDVSIWNVGPDKYEGRIVAQAATRRTPDISSALIAKGVARSYDGGHRDGWCG